MDQKTYEALIAQGRSDAAQGYTPNPHLSGQASQVYSDAYNGKK